MARMAAIRKTTSIDIAVSIRAARSLIPSFWRHNQIHSPILAEKATARIRMTPLDGSPRREAKCMCNRRSAAMTRLVRMKNAMSCLLSAWASIRSMEGDLPILRGGVGIVFNCTLDSIAVANTRGLSVFSCKKMPRPKLSAGRGRGIVQTWVNRASTQMPVRDRAAVQWVGSGRNLFGDRLQADFADSRLALELRYLVVVVGSPVRP